MVTFQGKLRKQHVVPSFLSAGQIQECSGAWGNPPVPRNKAITHNVHSVVKLFFSDFRVRMGNRGCCPALRRSLHLQGRFGVKLGNLQTVGISSETSFSAVCRSFNKTEKSHCVHTQLQHSLLFFFLPKLPSASLKRGHAFFSNTFWIS